MDAKSPSYQTDRDKRTSGPWVLTAAHRGRSISMLITVTPLRSGARRPVNRGNPVQPDARPSLASSQRFHLAVAVAWNSTSASREHDCSVLRVLDKS